MTNTLIDIVKVNNNPNKFSSLGIFKKIGEIGAKTIRMAYTAPTGMRYFLENDDGTTNADSIGDYLVPSAASMGITLLIIKFPCPLVI